MIEMVPQGWKWNSTEWCLRQTLMEVCDGNMREEVMDV